MQRAPIAPPHTRAEVWQMVWRAARSRVLAEADDAALQRAVAIAVRQGFVLTMRQATLAGIDEARIRRLLRRGAWRRVGFGVVAVIASDLWDAEEVDEFEQARRDHALRAAAAALARPHHLVCATSAATMHGLPLRRLPVHPIATARELRTLGSNGGVLVRRSRLAPSDETSWFGVPVTTLPRTIIDLARNDRRDGVIAADAALRESLVTRDELWQVVVRSSGWPGIRTARMIVDFADPLAESPLESLVRLALRDSRLPTPDLQVEITDPVTGQRYRSDFLWRQQRLVLEADGRLKYRDDELWQEKQRELALSRAGFRVERVVWGDLHPRVWPAFVTRIARILASSPLR
jgi:very-short-patch-repair endonuclease